MLALAAIAQGFWKWHEYGPPDWQPVAVLGLLSLPLLARYSITVSRDAEANVIGLSAAVLFASSLGADSHIFPVWALIVLASSIAFKGGLRYGLPRGTDDVVAGWALVTVAPYIDLGLRPFDRTLVALLVFVAVEALVFWVRRRLRGQQSPQQALDRSSTALALFGLYFASVFIAALRRTYTAPSSAGNAEVAVMGLSLVVATLIGYSMSQNLIRGVAVLSEAATNLPWPADENDRLVIRFARSAIRSATADIVPRTGPPGSLSASIDEVRYMVLRRMTGDRAYTEADQRLLEAVAAMASVSRSVDLREAGLRLRSITDAMTGLWNYPMFVELAEQAIRERAEGEVLALLFLDLDKFKQLNEELGHFDADQVLCEIAGRLQEAAPPTAAVARFAGDEFALLLRGVDRDTGSPTCPGAGRGGDRADRGRGPVDDRPRQRGSRGQRRRRRLVDDVMRVAEEHMREAKRAGRAASASRDEKDMVSDHARRGRHRGRLPADRRRSYRCPVGMRGAAARDRPRARRGLTAHPGQLRRAPADPGRADREDRRGGARRDGRARARVEAPLQPHREPGVRAVPCRQPRLRAAQPTLGERGVQLVLELSERSYGRGPASTTCSP